MRLTNENLLLLLAFVGDEGLTASELADRLGVASREAKWRLLRFERRGLVLRDGHRQRPNAPAGGRPAVVWRLVEPLAASPAPKPKLQA
jgi:predicted ArsR family transcriptional regulator